MKTKRKNKGYKVWTNEDIAYLKTNYPSTDNKVLAVKMDREAHLIAKKASNIGLRKASHQRSKWGVRHTQFLLDNHSKMSIKEIAKALKVSKSTVDRYIIENGLVNENAFKHWTSKEVRFLQDNYKTMRAKEIAKELGRTVTSVYGMVRCLKLKKNKVK